MQLTLIVGTIPINYYLLIGLFDIYFSMYNVKYTQVRSCLIHYNTYFIILTFLIFLNYKIISVYKGFLVFSPILP